MKKLFLFIAAALVSTSMWAATETATNTGTKDNALEGTCYTIAATYIAGKGSVQTDPMANKGVKVRTDRAATTDGTKSNVIEFKVNRGYKITAISLCGNTNTNDKAITLGSAYVDGTAYAGSIETGSIVAKNTTTSTAVTTLTNIEATSAIIFTISDLNSTNQANIYYEITYVVLPTYTVTYDLNGAGGTTPTETAKLASETFTLHDGVTDIEAPTGASFAGWNDGSNTYAGGATYTMGSSNVTLTAQWLTPSVTPTISAHPSTSDAEYIKDADATALSVTASNGGVGTLTYQWYKNTSNTTAGATAIDGATNASYTPSTDALGTLYYYCAVTNTETSKAPITVNSNFSGAISVILDPLGSHTIIYTLDVTESADGSKTSISSENESTSKYLNTLVGITKVGLGNYGTGSKANLTVTIPTLEALDASKYMSVGFSVTSGYKFTPTSITVKAQPVSTNKDVKLVLVDNNSDSIGVIQSSVTAGNIGTITLSNNSNVAFTGNVTLKIYCYGAATDKTYRLGSPITIAGTVAAITPPTAIENTNDETKAVKRIENGILIIEKNGIRYNAQGQVIR